MSELVLAGCQPEPLAGYLKALGVLRLVAAQTDRDVRGHWSPAGFVLTTRLSDDDLCAYFLDRYEPTPIVSPWNGGSGFNPKDNTEGLLAILESSSDRLAEYQRVIRAVQNIGPIGDGESKDIYLTRLRNELPDSALPWLDAAVVVGDDGARFPILLGTGGNDGRLDFSNNHMQRLADALRLRPAKRKTTDPSPGWLRAALFADVRVNLVDAAIGQFDPGGAGGSNSSPQGKGKSLVNPWDFVLMLEGAVVFAGAAVRRRPEGKQSISVPFSFNATNAGYASAAEENGRGEIWAPLWSEPSRMSSVTNLFAEGRVTWDGRQARVGLDAVRAIATLQFDRRIDEFVRYSITERFGLSNVAVPVGRVVNPRIERADVGLTQRLDPWLRSVRAFGERGMPTSVLTALRNVDGALVELARSPVESSRGNLLFEVLNDAATLERAVARSTKLRERVRPIRNLKASEWEPHLAGVLASSSEARLAWSLASGRDAPSRQRDTLPSLRELVMPIAMVPGSAQWTVSVAIEGLESLSIDALLARVAAKRQWISPSRRDGEDVVGARLCNERGARARIGDAIRLARGEVDAGALGRYLRAFLVLEFDRVSGLVRDVSDSSRLRLDALTAAALAHAGVKKPSLAVPPGLVAQLVADSPGAVKLLERALRIAGRDPFIAQSTDGRGQWLAASLLLNVSPQAERLINAAGYMNERDASTINASAVDILDAMRQADEVETDLVEDETPGADAPNAGG